MATVASIAPQPAPGLINLEAEAAFLGAVLFDNDALRSLDQPPGPADFSDPVHARIFELASALIDRGAVANPPALRPHFDDETFRYLFGLTANTAGIIGFESLAEQVAELAHRRRAREAALQRADALADLSLSLEQIPAIIDDMPTKRSALPLIDMTGWDRPAPARRSAWGDWLPMLKTTLLTGEGGVGKSLFVQMLLTATALGRPFLGMDTIASPSLYLTAEDDAEELWRRQRAICEAFEVKVADLADKLFLVSLDGESETALIRFDSERRMTLTPRWRQIEAAAALHGIRYFGLDNATDLIACDHNDAHEVAASVNVLTGLAIKRDGVALLLAHPNRAGDDWSGSVAWHNKVRSRLIVKRAGSADPDGRTIENPKANYGQAGSRIEFRWHQGAFIRDADLPEDKRAELSDIIIANGENAAFLACLRERASQGDGRHVGPTSGPSYAPAQFEGMTQAKGYDRRALKRAMDRLFTIGKIETRTVRNTSKGRDVTVIVEVPEPSPNATPNASRTLIPDAPEQRPNAPRTDPAHTPLPTGGVGEALKAPSQPPEED